MQLENKKVTKSTYEALNVFIYENRKTLDEKEVLFLSFIRYAIYYEITKPAARRNSMEFLITVNKERVYNPELYAKRINAVSYSIESV